MTPLEFTLFLPWLAGIVLARTQTQTRAARRIATTAASVGAALTALLPLWPSAHSMLDVYAWQVWSPGVVALVGLAAVAMTPVASATPRTVSRTLTVSALSVGLVMARHPALLAALWALSIVPVWTELHERDDGRYAARAFLAYMLPSALLVGLGATLQLRGRGDLAILPLAIGIALRQAVVPLHSWFPGFVQRAPLGLVVAFAASQVGVHAHLVLLGGTLPPELDTLVATLGAVTAVYAAALGVVQSQTRRALGYLIMSQSGLLAFGLDTHAGTAHAGTLVEWMVIGLSTSGFAMVIAALEARRGTLSLDRPEGSFRRVPRLAAAFLVAGLASVGLPGTLGFIGEDLLVQGSVDEFPILALSLIVATAFNGMTVIRNFFLLFNGTARHIGEQDLTMREAWTLSLVLLLLIGTGLVPAPLVAAVTGHAMH